MDTLMREDRWKRRRKGGEKKEQEEKEEENWKAEGPKQTHTTGERK